MSPGGGSLRTITEGWGGIGVSGGGGGIQYVSGGGGGGFVSGGGGGAARPWAGAMHVVTEGAGGAWHFTLSTGAVMPSPAPHVAPMQATHFHGPRIGHVSNSPTRSEVIHKQTLPYEPLKLDIVWDPNPPDMKFLVNWAEVIKTPSPDLVHATEDVHLTALLTKGAGQLVYDFSTHITQEKSSSLKQVDNSQPYITNSTSTSQSSTSSIQTNYQFDRQVVNTFDFSSGGASGGIYVDPLSLPPDQSAGGSLQMSLSLEASRTSTWIWSFSADTVSFRSPQARERVLGLVDQALGLLNGHGRSGGLGLGLRGPFRALGCGPDLRLQRRRGHP